MDKIDTCIRAVASEGGWALAPQYLPKLDSDLFDIIYDTGTHFKCYKTSFTFTRLRKSTRLHLRCLYFKFFREACPHTSLQFSKKNLSP